MAAGYFALSIVLSLRIINLVQLEGYKLVNSRKMKAVRLKLWGGAFCITLCNLLFLFIAIAIGNSYIQLAVQGLYIVILLVSLTDERDKCTHQPLVFTPRAKRLIVTYGIVAAAAVALCVTAGCFIRSGEVWACFIFIPLAMALLPEYVMLALIINKPFEKAIAGRYVKKCKDKLQSMHLLRIGITGSFGKTSVKHFAAAILSLTFLVFSSIPRAEQIILRLSFAATASTAKRIPPKSRLHRQVLILEVSEKRKIPGASTAHGMVWND